MKRYLFEGTAYFKAETSIEPEHLLELESLFKLHLNSPQSLVVDTDPGFYLEGSAEAEVAEAIEGILAGEFASWKQKHGYPLSELDLEVVSELDYDLEIPVRLMVRFDFDLGRRLATELSDYFATNYPQYDPRLELIEEGIIELGLSAQIYDHPARESEYMQILIEITWGAFRDLELEGPTNLDVEIVRIDKARTFPSLNLFRD